MSDQSAFGLALAARKGKIPPEQLGGAAKKLYHDTTLSDDMLASYSAARPSVPSRPRFRVNKRFRRT